ncbi:MAG: bifunctional 5,10-methylene-tetrahydrofolate dehydrogenase/5,10-methylene-tetrahydrofolate cyclohydrolase, partial [Deltaproteobacteria bacterium GWC2_42_11]
MAKIIDGKAIARHIKQKLKTDADKLKENGIMPGLAVVLVGNNPASLVYVRAKGKACDEVGIASFQHNLPEDIRQEELIELIKKLNADTSVNGILVQLPLPPHLNEEAVLETILPSKDVDGFHPFNVGRLVTGKPLLQPCTPYGIMKILESEGIEISGKHAVIIGRSNIIGKPAAIMLLQRNATVTICHSKTKDLPHITRQADILI